MGPTPQELKHEIDRTRADLASTVDTLADKVSPGGAARRGASKATAAVSSARDTVMGTTHGLTSAVGDAATGAPQAAVRGTRGNPVAAGLIAFGAGLLTASLLPTTHKEQQAFQHIAHST